MDEEIFELQEYRGLKVGDSVLYRSNPRSAGKVIKIARRERYYNPNRLPSISYYAEVNCLSGKTNRYSIYRLELISHRMETLEQKLEYWRARKELVEKL